MTGSKTAPSIDFIARVWHDDGMTHHTKQLKDCDPECSTILSDIEETSSRIMNEAGDAIFCHEDLEEMLPAIARVILDLEASPISTISTPREMALIQVMDTLRMFVMTPHTLPENNP